MGAPNTQVLPGLGGRGQSGVAGEDDVHHPIRRAFALDFPREVYDVFPEGERGEPMRAGVFVLDGACNVGHDVGVGVEPLLVEYVLFVVPVEEVGNAVLGLLPKIIDLHASVSTVLVENALHFPEEKLQYGGSHKPGVERIEAGIRALFPPRIALIYPLCFRAFLGVYHGRIAAGLRAPFPPRIALRAFRGAEQVRQLGVDGVEEAGHWWCAGRGAFYTMRLPAPCI
jgi:hypothetical protein